MILNMDWSDFPHLSQHHRELAEHMAQGPGEQALVNAQLEQLRRLCSDSVETRPRTVETLSDRPAQPRPIRMDPPKFDGTSPHTIVHWLLAVEKCGVALLIEGDTRMVSYAMSNLLGKASEWAYSALMANADAFPSWAIFETKIRAMYQPPNNEVLFMARFFGARQAKRSLQEFVQEMRSLLASINGEPIPELIKVATFMNGLRHGPSRQALFRKVPATMEEAIDIALVEEQSYNSASATAYYRPSSERSDATPMELGNADGIFYNQQKVSNPKGGAKKQRARRTGLAPAQDGSGNAGAQ
ncbi:unnamed protein product [Peronospora effusa]|nr:unnamed protein product [Peronospora effusa]